MKQTILIYLALGLFFSTFCQVAKTSKSFGVDGIYKCNVPQTKAKHYIIIQTTNGKRVGKYIGFEPTLTDTIYYSAIMDSLKIVNGRRIGFQLKNYQFSITPINPLENNILAADQNEIKKELEKRKAFPSVLEFGLYIFWGTIDNKTLNLQRVADWYDNRSDQMTFNKTSVK
jgi:hypothetical protein